MSGDRGRDKNEDRTQGEADEEAENIAAAEEVLKDRGLFYLPDVPEESQEEEGPPEFGWRDVLAFIIASYQIIFPFLGAVVLIFLLIWGVLWLLS